MEELKVLETKGRFVVVIVVRKVNETIVTGGVNVEVIRFVEKETEECQKNVA